MRFSFKGFTSLLLFAVFVGLAWSGALLYVSPRGRVANWTGWTLMGLTKDEWVSLHINLAVLFIIAAAVHLILNWTMFWGYIKKKAGLGLNLKWEMLAAAILATVVCVGSVRDWPPFSAVIAWNQRIKDSWEPGASDAPAPHAEEFTLERLASSMSLSADEVAKALQDEGFVVPGASALIGQIAEANGTTPQAIYAALRRRFPQIAHATSANEMGGKPMGQGPGAKDHQPGKGWGKGRGLGKGMGLGGKGLKAGD